MGGSSPRIEREENPSIMDWSVGGRPSREWWAVLGTVAEAAEGLGSWDFCCGGFDLKYEAGKCFALYSSCTLSLS